MSVLLDFAYAMIPVFVVLVGSELWWRSYGIHDEFSRKFVHITVGSYVAFWPYFLSWDEIRLLSLAFLIVVSVSKYLHVFQAIHNVQRPTYGELFFALAVGGVTFITHSPSIYAVAMLQMSLADGFAAIVGTQMITNKRYRVLGHTKSVAGTLTFFVVALLVLIGYNACGNHDSSYVFIALLAAASSAIENLGVAGLDNLLVPVLTAAVLIHG